MPQKNIMLFKYSPLHTMINYISVYYAILKSLFHPKRILILSYLVVVVSQHVGLFLYTNSSSLISSAWTSSSHSIQLLSLLLLLLLLYFPNNLLKPLTVIRQLSNSYQTVIRQLSDRYQTVIRKLLDSY